MDDFFPSASLVPADLERDLSSAIDLRPGAVEPVSDETGDDTGKSTNISLSFSLVAFFALLRTFRSAGEQSRVC